MAGGLAMLAGVLDAPEGSVVILDDIFPQDDLSF